MSETLSLVLQILFWLSAGAVVYSYVLFPLLLKLWAGGRKRLLIPPGGEQRLPAVTIIMAAHNEERVIAKRLDNLLAQDYPMPVTIVVGTDACTDCTNDIIAEYVQRHPNIRLQAFSERQGKPKIVNELIAQAKDDILVLTDANVFFAEDVLLKLGRHFVDPRVGVVSGNVLTRSIGQQGIAQVEHSYLSYESNIKFYESLLFDSCIGVHGACYAIRKSVYKPTPTSFLVDDFYIGMQALLSGKRSLMDPSATAYWPPMPAAGKEFKRRVRISIGNFQNLKYFLGHLRKFRFSALWCFLSHKVIRWLTPFFLILCLASNVLLSVMYDFYLGTLLLQLGLISGGLLDAILPKQAAIPVLRSLRHFYQMNLALLVGFFRWVLGRHKGIWAPSHRMAEA